MSDPKSEIAVTPTPRWTRWRSLAGERLAPWFRDAALPFALTISAVYVIAICFQEKILFCNGFGIDGCSYGNWARDFHANVIQPGLSDYYTQRVLPSAVVYGLIRLLHVEPTDVAIIRLFEGVNTALIFASALSFHAVCKRLSLSSSLRWLGAVCLFASHGVIKWTTYYPVLTDTWAFAFGMFQFQFYLSRRIVPLILVSVFGAFAWPTLLAIGAGLLFFCGVERHAPAEPQRTPAHLHDIVAGLLTAAWIYACISVLSRNYDPGVRTDPINPHLVRLSVMVSAAFLFCGARTVLDDGRLFNPRLYLRGLCTLPGLVAPVLVIATTLVRRRALANETVIWPWHAHLDLTVFTAIKAPGEFALAHVIFLGPIFLIVYCRWRDVVRLIHRQGMGLTMLMFVSVLLALNSESRKLLNIAPILVPLTLQLIAELRPPAQKLMQFALVSVFFSKFWFTMDGGLTGPPGTFPEQSMFMNHGPWISITMYAVQGVVVLLVAYWMRGWLPRRVVAPDANSAP